MIRKQSTDPVFGQVSVRLSDAAHRKMNQKYAFFKKKRYFPMGFDVNVVRCVYFLESP